MVLVSLLILIAAARCRSSRKIYGLPIPAGEHELFDSSAYYSDTAAELNANVCG